MCPLVAAPNRGYPDWQRIDNYDSGVLWNENASGLTGITSSPVMDVSRYSNLAGYLQVGGTDAFVFVRWYADAAKTLQVGERDWTMQIGGAPKQVLLRNMGPYAQMNIEPITGASLVINAVVFASNRQGPVENPPRSDVLINQQAVNIGASQTINILPSEYFSGPVNVWCQCASTSVAFTLQPLNTGDAYFTSDQLSPGAGGQLRGVMQVPFDAWRFQVVNLQAIAGQIWLVVTADSTGSS